MEEYLEENHLIFHSPVIDSLTYLTTLDDESVHLLTVEGLYESFMLEEFLRVLKIGGFLLVMSNTKDMYQTGVAIQEAGFHLIDTLAWLNPKAPDNTFAVNYLVDRMTYLTDDERKDVASKVNGLRVINLKKSFTPFIIFQKAPMRNQTLNQYIHGVGLMNRVKTNSGICLGNVATDSFDAYFMTPRLKIFKNQTDTVRRAWVYLLEIFSHPECIVLDLTEDNKASTACIYLKRHYKTVLSERKQRQKMILYLTEVVRDMTPVSPNHLVFD